MSIISQYFVVSNDIKTTYPLNDENKIVLPTILKEKVLKKYYKTKFSDEVMKELHDNYYTPIPYLDMGYIVRYCSDIGYILYGNILYQYVQNYLEFLYGYKDYTDGFTEIMISIKNTFKHSSSLPLFKYYEVMDDYRYPGGHSGGSFSVCIGTLYRLISINDNKKLSKKDKLANWYKYCVNNKFHVIL